MTADPQHLSPYLHFSRTQWAHLRDAVPLSLTELDLIDLRGIHDELSLDEVRDIYLPLSRLLNLYVKARQHRSKVIEQFLGTNSERVPYIISIAGSVAVGKSTTARILQALLEHWPEHPKVELITTDGFLHPNQVLEERGLMKKRGFPSLMICANWLILWRILRQGNRAWKRRSIHTISTTLFRIRLKLLSNLIS